jgi:hypothetical protein
VRTNKEIEEKNIENEQKILEIQPYFEDLKEVHVNINHTIQLNH